VTLTLIRWPSYTNLTCILGRYTGCVKMNYLRQVFSVILWHRKNQLRKHNLRCNVSQKKYKYCSCYEFSDDALFTFSFYAHHVYCSLFLRRHISILIRQNNILIQTLTVLMLMTRFKVLSPRLISQCESSPGLSDERWRATNGCRLSDQVNRLWLATIVYTHHRHFSITPPERWYLVHYPTAGRRLTSRPTVWVKKVVPPKKKLFAIFSIVVNSGNWKLSWLLSKHIPMFTPISVHLSEYLYELYHFYL